MTSLAHKLMRFIVHHHHRVAKEVGCPLGVYVYVVCLHDNIYDMVQLMNKGVGKLIC